jgi:hypothetical protein
MMKEREVILSVADFKGDFEEARMATEKARDLFMTEAKEEKVTIASVQSVEFIEFDSSNPTHAGAYFLVTYDGGDFSDE